MRATILRTALAVSERWRLFFTGAGLVLRYPERGARLRGGIARKPGDRT